MAVCNRLYFSFLDGFMNLDLVLLTAGLPLMLEVSNSKQRCLKSLKRYHQTRKHKVRARYKGFVAEEPTTLG